MSINFCTLTNASVDTFCGNRRSVVLNNLLQKKYPPVTPTVGNGSGYQVRNEFAFKNPALFARPEEQPTLNFEQPFITVQVELMGEVATQQLELAPQLEFVVVSDLQVTPADVTVNISDLSI